MGKRKANTDKMDMKSEIVHKYIRPVGNIERIVLFTGGGELKQHLCRQIQIGKGEKGKRGKEGLKEVKLE